MNITDEQRQEAFDASAPLAEVVELGPGELVGLLKPYVAHRDAETEAKKEKERIASLLKHYLERHEDETLWDGEAQLEARLEPYSLPGQSYDVLTLWQQEPALFARLVQHGCVRLDPVAIQTAGANVGGVNRFAYPKGKGTRLTVKAVK